MKNTFSIAERNHIVEAHLGFIDEIIEENGAQIRQAGLERDDTYQQLALQLIVSVAEYDADLAGDMGTYIRAQLQHELRRYAKETGRAALFIRSSSARPTFQFAVAGSGCLRPELSPC